MHQGWLSAIFWDAPYSYFNASTDIGEVVVDWIKGKFSVANEGNLAVLHNRNKMVNAFASTERVSGVYPPLALVKTFITEEDSAPRVRRLHLIVVDLNRRRRLAARVKKHLSKIHVDGCADKCWNTLPIPWQRNQEAYQLRYFFGYAMDGSDLPCYILWPVRTAEQSFWCVDAWKGDWVQLDKCGFIAPVGIALLRCILL